MHDIEGTLEATDHKFGLAVSRYNSFITERLLEGDMDALLRHGASEEHITVLWTPGAFALPLAAQKMAQSGQDEAIIAVGAVIRGASPHFDFVAAECAKGLATASLNTCVTVINGVVTTDTIEQAIERAGTRVPNRGFEAAVTAIEMVNALRGLE